MDAPMYALLRKYGINACYKLNGKDQTEHIVNTLNSLLGTSVDLQQARTFITQDDTDRYERFVANKVQVAVEFGELEESDTDALNLYATNAFNDLIVEAYKDQFLKTQPIINNSNNKTAMAKTNMAIVGGKAAPAIENANVARPQVTNNIEATYGKFFDTVTKSAFMQGREMEWSMEGNKVVLYIASLTTTFVYNTINRHRDQWTIDEGVKYVWKSPAATLKAFDAVAKGDSKTFYEQLTPACYSRVMGDQNAAQTAPTQTAPTQTDEKPVVRSMMFDGMAYKCTKGGYLYFVEKADKFAGYLLREDGKVIYSETPDKGRVDTTIKKYCTDTAPCTLPMEYYNRLVERGVCAPLDEDADDAIEDAPEVQTAEAEPIAEPVAVEPEPEPEPIAVEPEPEPTPAPTKLPKAQTVAAQTAEPRVEESAQDQALWKTLEILQQNVATMQQAIAELQNLIASKYAKAI